MKYLRVILIVLLLMCCSLWVASYWGISWVNSDGLHSMFIRNGFFKIGWLNRGVDLPYGLTTYGYTDLHTYWWPVVYIYTDPYHWTLSGSFWLPTLLLALPLAISASPWARRRRRAKQGLCIRCGYDLSGSVSGVCSECGVQAG